MSAHPTGGFSLFPNPNDDPRPPSRSQNRPRAASPRSGRSGSSAREDRQKAVSNNPWQHALDAARSGAAGPSTAPDAVAETAIFQPVTEPPQRCETAFSEAQTLVRSPSQRSRSSIAKPPIAHTTDADPSSSSQPGESQAPAAIRSIFPRYNPDLPLSQQEYYPTLPSPTHIPQSAISRPLYSARGAATTAEGSSSAAGAAHPAGSPQAGYAAARSPPFMGQRRHEPAVMPSVSTTEDLRGLWKAANGWRAAGSEGRNYCLKMTASVDLPPSYTLSSSTSHPFYCLRVEPTSSSALVTLHRYDPAKPFKPASAGSSSARASPDGSGGATPSPRTSWSSRQSNYPVIPQTTAFTPSNTAPKYQKNWQEVLSTHLAPAPLLASSQGGGAGAGTGTGTGVGAGADSEVNSGTAGVGAEDGDDGLVAQLWPAAAARLVADRANDAATVALAQQESARLVWDADSGHHFLVHPALAVPFCVAVDRHPALSRTEYTLEHLESPAHLARLVRDGTGSGWLEIDTAVAAKVEAVYLVDVAVAALVLVAHLDAKKNGSSSAAAVRGGPATAAAAAVAGLEIFEPPPVVYSGRNGSIHSSGSRGDGHRRSSSWNPKRVMSRASGRRKNEDGDRGSSGGNSSRRKTRKPAEQFELDLESQNSDLGKGGADADKDKVPGVLRALVGIVTVTFKCFVWCITLSAKMLLGILSLFTRCCGLGKL
ncbi:hypothetical protein VTH82DRAFT_2940 [Thermothelomyces myriococcoides]